MSKKFMDRMLARTGVSWEQVRPNSTYGELFRRQGVPDSEEFQRIRALPRRQWPENENLEFLQDEMTQWLKVPDGTQRLRPVQATALAELHDYGGCFAPITVGGGKTLLSFLAPIVAEAKNPVLIIPAALREKTELEFRELANHWKQAPHIEIVTYQGLGRKNQVYLLEKEICPDLIIADEVHYLKNLGAAVTRRVARWMVIAPKTQFVGMSGTITKRSLMDFHHLLKWCLGPERMPLPVEGSETRRWALAVDAKVPVNRRMSSGVLVDFMIEPPEHQEPTQSEIRIGLSSRIMETPGVVGSLTDDIDAPIILDFYTPELPDTLQDSIDYIQQTKQDLNGDTLLEEVDVWRHVRELVCGFYYHWIEPAPPEWMTARRNWFAFVRRTLEAQIEHIDSPLQVANAVAAERLDSGGTYEMWNYVKNDFKPVTVPKWLDLSMCHDVLKRTTKHPTLIWVEHVAVGEKLAELSGVRFFNRKGLDRNKVLLDTLDGSESVIVSINSNREGRNLQAWSRNFIFPIPPNGAVLEQVMGRTHRFLQEADEVYFQVPVAHRVIQKGIDQAFEDAKYISELTNKTQKLLLADTSGTFIRKRNNDNG